MNKKVILSIALIPLFVITAGLACSFEIGSDTPEPGDRSSQEETSSLESEMISSVYELDEAVVLIDTEGSYIDPFEGWQVNAGTWGTGFIIDPEGIVVTNNHVVTGTSKLKVWLKGEDDPRNAKVLGVSECYDLAVIDIDGEGFPYVEWYADEIKAGIDVFSAGFPSTASEVDYTLTEGIVSKPATSLYSDWASVNNVIAHTAKIIGGNSGGPLVDESAAVVGVNYAGVDLTDENYAISRDIAIPIIDELEAGNDVDSIGVNGIAVNGDLYGNDVTGLWVRSVKSGSPADGARILAGDIIIELENQVLTQEVMKDYCDVLRSHKPEDTLAVTVIRSGTGEIFIGQLNGRELEYVSSLEVSEDISSDLSSQELGGSGDEIVENVFNDNVSEKGDIYYYENFNGGMEEDWEYFFVQGQAEDVFNEARDGVFHIKLLANDTFLYYRFKGWDFNDVRLDSQVENLGADTNYVGLVCRELFDGWYEANIRGNGDYSVYYYDANASENKYTELLSGNSEEINTGKDVNDLTLVCQGSELTFSVNGVVLATVELDTGDHQVLEKGAVGMNVASEEETPVIVEFYDFIISLP